MRLLSRQIVMQIVGVATVLTAVGAVQVSAVQNISPIQDDLIRQYDYTPRASQQYSAAADDKNLNTSNVVSSDGFTDVYTTKSKIFVPQGYTGTLIVHDANLCKTHATGLAGNNYDQVYTSQGAAPANGTQATQYSVGSTVRIGTWQSGNTCWGNTVSIPLAGGAIDPDTNMLVYTFTATQTRQAGQAGFVNMFWLEVPDPAPGVKAIISQSASTSAPNYGVQLSSPIPTSGGDVYYDMAVPFAPDCSFIASNSATGKGMARLVIYDDDNGTGSTVQPKPFFIGIQEFNRSDTVNPTKKIYLNAQAGDPTNFADLAYSSAGAQLRDAGSNATTKWYRPFTSFSKQKVSATFEVDITKVYKLILRNVYYDNTLQFQIPFDTVYYYTGCIAPSDWRLEGATTTTSAAVVQPGATINWKHTLRNTGADATTMNSQAIVHRSFNGVEDFSASVTRNIASGVAAGATPMTENRTYTTTSADLGKTVCEWLTWTNVKTTIPAGATSRVCIRIEKSPLLAIVGGDASAGGSTTAPCIGDVTKGKIIGATIGTTGSFGEYGLFATNDITDFASAAVLAPPSSLTFANTPSGTSGHFETSHCLQDYAIAYQTQANTSGESTWTNGTLNAANAFNKFSSSNPTNAISGTINAGSNIVIYAPTKTIRINGDIKYSNGSLSSFARVPSLIIIADRIEIEAGVREIAGIFYAKSVFNSCIEATDLPNNNKAAIKSGGTCSNKLTVNGAAIAGQFILPRTYGGDPTNADPAEAFVYRPEVFLTQYERNAASGNLVVDFAQELPPRY